MTSPLPLFERRAAARFLARHADNYPNQFVAAEALGIAQQTINKAILHDQVGPYVMRAVLDYLRCDLRELIARYGDPSLPVPPHLAAQATTAPEPKSPKDEAIEVGIRYGGGISEREVRAIADRFDAALVDAPVIAWIETLLREIQRSYTRPLLEKTAERRARASKKRAIRRAQASRNAATEPSTPVAPPKSGDSHR